MVQNWPFMATIMAALALTTYMVLNPAHGLRHLMQLTEISASYKVTLLVLGGVYLILAWTSENYLFQRLARWVGKAKLAMSNTPKERKEYKVILERMQI
jgi:cation-transporting ATPase 13A2